MTLTKAAIEALPDATRRCILDQRAAIGQWTRRALKAEKAERDLTAENTTLRRRIAELESK